MVNRFLNFFSSVCILSGCIPDSRGADTKFADVPSSVPVLERKGVLPAELPASVRTNLLALHLLAEEVALHTNGNPLRPSPELLPMVRVLPEPIISDADLVAWDQSKHTFVITSAAAKRLIRNHLELDQGGQFMLMTRGQPIYLGIFGSSVSSFTYSVPVILTDDVVNQYFMGWRKVPLDVLRQHAAGNPVGTDRLLALTLPVTNVVLKIDPGYPYGEELSVTNEVLNIGPRYPFDQAFRAIADPRDDLRIVLAVERLFGKSSH